MGLWQLALLEIALVFILIVERRRDESTWYVSHSCHLIERAWQDKIDENDARPVCHFAIVLLTGYVLKWRCGVSIFASTLDTRAKNDLLDFDQVDHFGNFPVDRVLRLVKLRIAQIDRHFLYQFNSIAYFSDRQQLFDLICHNDCHLHNEIAFALLCIYCARLHIFMLLIVLL